MHMGVRVLHPVVELAAKPGRALWLCSQRAPMHMWTQAGLGAASGDGPSLEAGVGSDPIGDSPSSERPHVPTPPKGRLPRVMCIKPSLPQKPPLLVRASTCLTTWERTAWCRGSVACGRLSSLMVLGLSPGGGGGSGKWVPRNASSPRCP